MQIVIKGNPEQTPRQSSSRVRPFSTWGPTGWISHSTTPATEPGVWHFVTKKQGNLGKSIDSIPKNVMQMLVDYDWPGNIRELENVIERAMILTTRDALSLPEPLKNVPRMSKVGEATGRRSVDRAQIIATLQAFGWKIKGTGNAAERLGLKPSTLRYRMKVLGIRRPAKGKD
jgi:transcriptional regulator with GAF, ATPase, and Fis domain